MNDYGLKMVMISWYWLIVAFLVGFVAATYLLLWKHDLVEQSGE